MASTGAWLLSILTVLLQHKKGSTRRGRKKTCQLLKHFIQNRGSALNDPEVMEGQLIGWKLKQAEERSLNKSTMKTNLIKLFQLLTFRIHTASSTEAQCMQPLISSHHCSAHTLSLSGAAMGNKIWETILFHKRIQFKGIISINHHQLQQNSFLCWQSNLPGYTSLNLVLFSCSECMWTL